MLKLRDFWVLIAAVSFVVGIYDFVELKVAKQSGDLIRETRIRADAYTEIAFGLGSVIIYELAAINANLKREHHDKWETSQLSKNQESDHYSNGSLTNNISNKVKL